MDSFSWPGLVQLEETTSIRDALRAVDLGASSAALVIGSSGRFLGIVTDGDIRRALLSGVGLEDALSPLITRNPLTVAPSESRSAVLDLMQAFQVSVIPVVSDGNLVGVHLLHEIIGRINRNATCLVLAGGKGTRLGDITAAIPKPMVPVAGRPILERLLLHFIGHGINSFIFSIGHFGQQIEDYFGNGSKYGCTIHYVQDPEDQPLGTGGPLAFVPSLLKVDTHQIIVVNGDLVTQADIGALLNAHTLHGADLTIAAYEHSYQVPYGVLSSVDGLFVTEVVEKPLISWPINAGLYVFNTKLLENLTPGNSFPLTQFVNQHVRDGRRVVLWHMEASWIDVGTPAELSRARGER